MHDNVGDGPNMPEDWNKSDQPADLTQPDLSCLEGEQREKLAETISAVIAAFVLDSETLIETSMDAFVSMGAHMVGHGLNVLVWSSFQTMLLNNGVRPHDIMDMVVSVATKPSDRGLTEQDNKNDDMVSEFVKATMSGAHMAAIDAWSKWVEELGPDDWGNYTTGVAMLIQVMRDNIGARLDNAPALAEFMNTPEGLTATRVVPRREQ